MAKSSTHQSKSSKRKKVELSPNKDTAAVDRLSNLPDSLLCHILSFLPTQKAVATSVLSSRWKRLWTHVPALDLYDVGRQPILLLYRILLLNKAPSLRNFNLEWYYHCDSLHLNTWIDAAIERNVENLYLEIFLDDDYYPHGEGDVYSGELYELPVSFYACKTVVVLHLSGGIELDPPPSFQLPCLKKLCLLDVFYCYEDSLSRLFNGCPVLEDLKVIRNNSDGMVYLNISVPTLKCLLIEFNTYQPRVPDYKLEINAPGLKNFKFRGDLRNVVFVEKLANVVEANVKIYAVECYEKDWVEHYEFYYGDRVFKLLRALNNAKFLSLSPGDIECLGFGSIYPSRFQNLVRLKFGVNKSNWHVLQALLLVAPNLEVLDVHKCYHISEDKLCWTELPDGPGYLSSRLSTFNFDGYKGLEHEVEFVKYILKEAQGLQTMTIQVSGRQSRESVLEKLSLFPRHSKTCLITVE